MRTIRVTGKGMLRVKPDVMRITLSLEGTDMEYGKTLEQSARETEKLKELMAEFGLERSSLKTLRFDVDTDYRREKVGDSYESRFAGYKYEHVMKVEFSADRERVGKILYALAHCPMQPEIRLSYTVSDPEGAKNELLSRAVTDAKEKACVLTQAAGVRLGSIQNIDYSWGEIEFEMRPMQNMMMADALPCPTGGQGSYDLDIEPDDEEVTDTVSMIWEIS